MDEDRDYGQDYGQDRGGRGGRNSRNYQDDGGGRGRNSRGGQDDGGGRGRNSRGGQDDGGGRGGNSRGGQDDGGGRGGNSRNDEDDGGGRRRHSRNRGEETPCAGECVRTPLKAPTIGVKDILSPRFCTMMFAELLGTFFLVFMGCGSVKAYAGVTARLYAPSDDDMEKTDVPVGASNDSSNVEMRGIVDFNAGQQAVMIAFAFGITVACIAQAIGHVSGAHLNPAVSFGLVAAGQCSLLQALCYTLVQIIGACLASGLLYLSTCKVYDPYTTETVIGCWNLAVSLPSVPPVYAVIIEFVLTFLLVLVVCGVCDDLRKDIKGSAPLAIGLTVFVCHVTGMQYSGSSINPARSIGPVVFPANMQKEAIEHIWIYILGPLLGGLTAGLIYQVFFREKETQRERLERERRENEMRERERRESERRNNERGNNERGNNDRGNNDRGNNSRRNSDRRRSDGRNNDRRRRSVAPADDYNNY